VAIKKMKKSLMIHKNKVVELKCSFQDERSLYLVM
jgi:serine/threonine protein kinase